MPSVLGLIPARGGSKGIPRKNIVDVGGKPLIAWTIEAARAADGLERVVVSTDDEEIASVARQYGAEVPFLRPAGLAKDDSASMDVVLHAMNWLESEEDYSADYLMLLQPTSPLRKKADIEGAIRLAEENEAKSVVSLCLCGKHPYWTRAVDAEGRIFLFLQDGQSITRRQDLPEAYNLNGAIFLARWEVLAEKKSWDTDATYAWVMNKERSLDIDELLELHIADLILGMEKHDGQS